MVGGRWESMFSRQAIQCSIASLCICLPSVSGAQGDAAGDGTSKVLNAAVRSAHIDTTALEPRTEMMHLEIGHTLFLDTQTRVSRVYVANPAVLDSYIVSPKQILLTAKGTGITSVSLWDEKDQTRTYLVSSDIDLAPLRDAVKGQWADENIVVDVHQGRVVLSGTVSSQAVSESAEKLAAIFTKDVVNSIVVNSAKARQVQLKVRFIEVDRSRLDQFGINIFAPGGTSSAGSGTTAQFPSTATLSNSGGTGLVVGGNTLAVSDPLNFLFFSTKTNVGVSIKDLENRQLVQILAEPTITTLSGQPASFLAGGEFPFPVVQGSSTGATSITIQFRPFGVRLAFTPKVNVDGSIELKVTPEVSALDYTNAVSISGYTIPAISTKHVDTQVVLRSGQSFAISGLLDRRTTDALARTPGIANVPLLGALFRSKGINLSTSELLVVVTPTLFDPVADGAGPSNPELPRPFLNDKSFDSSIPSARKP